MSQRQAFSGISSEFRTLYESGLSIRDIISRVNRSYRFVRNRMLRDGTLLRKGDGARLYLERHPEWKEQFVKCPGMQGFFADRHTGQGILDRLKSLYKEIGEAGDI